MRSIGLILLLILVPCAGIAAPPEAAVAIEVREIANPEIDVWPAALPEDAERYTVPAFGFFHVPYKYIDTGIRADRSAPCHFRASASIDIPAGKHRILLRGRGATKLTLNDKELLSLSFPGDPTNGHNPIRADYLDLGPDFRFAPPGSREKWTTWTSTGGPQRVVLETLIGSKKKGGLLRPEIGEAVVAISLQGSTSWTLLSPSAAVPYTDAGWAEYAASERKNLDRIEAERRAAALAANAQAIDRRRAIAKDHLASTPEPTVPNLPAGYPGNNPIDHFLAARHAEAASASTASGRIDFVRQIQPLLESKCFACHQGSKIRGGLRLDTLASAKTGGDSGKPAVVSGDPDASQFIARLTTKEPGQIMPPKGPTLTDKEVTLLRTWIEEGASYGSSVVRLTPLTDDLTFLRRVTLDTVGVVPTEAEVRDFLALTAEGRRERTIDRLLGDPRRADHWVGYWQDVLAENPNILNPTLNNTGPFRWWIYESFLDNKPFDVMVTELVRLRGSSHLGGPAGFALASSNDVPLAEKGILVASAFLGVQMKCARCHDAPGHVSTQRDLFELAAMLNENALKVPKTSSVPQDKLHQPGGREPLIKVTLKPGAEIKPAWSLRKLLTEDTVRGLLPENATPRDRLAALLTAPQNERFPEVAVNRVWARLMGRGIVDLVDDWEKGKSSHPELLRWLARDFVRDGYDLVKLQRRILTSHAYQRAVDPTLTEADPLFAAPARRRLTAEQVVDSLFAASGKPLRTEAVNLDIDGGRDLKNSLDLGKPRRAWQFASTSNERDRPSLALPRVQAVVDVLESFGWRATRPDGVSVRETAPNVLQPATLANGTVSIWLTRLSDDHGTTALALETQSVETLVDRLVMRVLTRGPRPEEKKALVEYLTPGYTERIQNALPPKVAVKRTPPRYVSWSNHLIPETTDIKRQMEAAARRGDPATAWLDPAWRSRLEDVVWAVLNTPEFVFAP